jgi:hypothetical protein
MVSPHYYNKKTIELEPCNWKCDEDIILYLARRLRLFIFFFVKAYIFFDTEFLSFYFLFFPFFPLDVTRHDFKHFTGILF